MLTVAPEIAVPQLSVMVPLIVPFADATRVILTVDVLPLVTTTPAVLAVLYPVLAA